MFNIYTDIIGKRCTNCIHRAVFSNILRLPFLDTFIYLPPLCTPPSLTNLRHNLHVLDLLDHLGQGLDVVELLLLQVVRVVLVELPNLVLDIKLRVLLPVEVLVAPHVVQLLIQTIPMVT